MTISSLSSFSAYLLLLLVFQKENLFFFSQRTFTQLSASRLAPKAPRRVWGFAIFCALLISFLWSRAIRVGREFLRALFRKMGWRCRWRVRHSNMKACSAD